MSIGRRETQLSLQGEGGLRAIEVEEDGEGGCGQDIHQRFRLEGQEGRDAGSVAVPGKRPVEGGEGTSHTLQGAAVHPC